MKFFLSTLLIIVLSVQLVSGDKAVRARKTRDVAKGSGANSLDKTERTSQAQGSLLSSSNVLDIKNAYLPSVFRVTSAIQALVLPQPPDARFWKTVEKSQEEFTDYVHYLLEAAGNSFRSNAFTDVRSAMNHIVEATASFRDAIKDTLEARDITFATLTDELEKTFVAIAEELQQSPAPGEASSHVERAEMVDKILGDTAQALVQLAERHRTGDVTIDTLTEGLERMFVAVVEEVKQIPPPDKTLSHAERAKMVDKILDDTTEALFRLAARYKIKEEVVATYLDALRPHVQKLIVAVGDINERYPHLLSLILFSIAVLLIPESWILRPFLSLFGFGPAGPVKGSIAAWLQRRFWGAAVASGSWFAWLQAAGMGVSFGWTWLVTKLPLWVFGVVVLMKLPCFIRRG